MQLFLTPFASTCTHKHFGWPFITIITVIFLPPIKTLADSKGLINYACGPPVLHRAGKWRQHEFNLQLSVMKFDSAKQPGLLIRRLRQLAVVRVSPLGFLFHLFAAEAQSPSVSSLNRLTSLIQPNMTHWAGVFPNNPPHLCLSQTAIWLLLQLVQLRRLILWPHLDSFQMTAVYWTLAHSYSNKMLPAVEPLTSATFK